MRTLAASVFGRLADWAETFRVSTMAESAAYWFYHWLGTFDVSLAFLFFSMSLMALYMLFRCLRRIRFFAALSLTLQLALLTMVALILHEKVLVIPSYEMLFIFGGVLLPLLYLLHDYIGMKRRVRVSCGPVPLVEKRREMKDAVMAGFHERALKPLKTAIRHGENDPSIYTAWVKALFEVKHAHVAVRVLRDAMASHPEDAGLRYLSARAKARCHDTEGALADLEAAVAIDAEIRLEARSCADFSAIRTTPGFIDLIRLPARQGRQPGSLT